MGTYNIINSENIICTILHIIIIIIIIIIN